MKKIVLAVISLLLCLSCLSCCASPKQGSEMPSTSENFDQSFVDTFFENYHVFDPNLYYLSASPWEIKMKTQSGDFYLATVNNADKNQFVSVTRHEIAYTGGVPSFTPALYQHIDAPVPMKDWTISSVSLICYWDYDNASHQYEDAKQFAQKPLEGLMSTMETLSTYESSASQSFFQSLKDSFTRRSDVIRGDVINKNDGEGKQYAYYLLVRFEENDSIIWISRLESDENGLYFNCNAKERDNNQTKLETARIDDQYATEILRLIEEHMGK